MNSVVEMIGREMDGEKCQRMAGRICWGLNAENRGRRGQGITPGLCLG